MPYRLTDHRRSSSLVAAAVLGLASTALHAGEASIEQRGDEGFVAIAVHDEFAKFDVGISQSGRHNRLELGVASDNVARIEQHGNNGKIVIDMLGLHDTLDLIQGGLDNRIDGRFTGADNSMTIDQSGSRNTMTLNLSGNDNRLLLEQSGEHNTLDFEHAGHGNRFDLRQHGDRNRLEVGHISGGTDVRITQHGSGDSVRITQ